MPLLMGQVSSEMRVLINLRVIDSWFIVTEMQSNNLAAALAS
jgi:hypothetical protein